MQAVLCYKTEEGINESGQSYEFWSAIQWPQQTEGVTGFPSKEEAAAGFVEAWNGRHNSTLTVTDFRIFGPVMTSTELSETGDGWYATTYADRKYETGPHSTLEECKAAFVEMWNDPEQGYSDAQENPVTETNVDWVNHP